MRRGAMWFKKFFFRPQKPGQEPIPEPAKKKPKKLPIPVIPKEEPADETNEIMTRLMDAVNDYKVGLYNTVSKFEFID